MLELNQTKKPKLKIFKGFWRLQDVLSESKSLFIFGDNDIKKGKKGQAVIRDANNSIGIPTKKFPSFKDDAYYSDIEFEINKQKIDISIKEIKAKLHKEGYEYLVIPEHGVGTGLAKLNEKAPKTFEYLEKVYSQLISEYQT